MKNSLKNYQRSILYAISKLLHTISTLKLIQASRFECKKPRKKQKYEELTPCSHVNTKKHTSTSIRRMIPLVRSPFSKHKYDYVRNEMRMRVG